MIQYKSPVLKLFLLFLTSKYCKKTLPFAIFSETLNCFAHWNLVYMALDEIINTISPGCRYLRDINPPLPSLSRDTLLLAKVQLVFPDNTVEIDLPVFPPETCCKQPKT